MKKADILQEIKRTAEANGGKPLGRQRFESETGIKHSDWLGKHWARWSDAIREAGLVPNVLNTAYDTAELVKKYAGLARELSRLHTSDDLRFKAHNDSTFPAANTFGRFGTKSALIRQLLEYCRNHREYDDVGAWCETYLSGNADVAEEPKFQEAEIGYVYLIKSGRFYKIGRTNAAGRREYELAIQLPEKAKTIHVSRTDDPGGIEAYWHNRFKAKRRNGEWFELSAADVAAFKRRKFM